MNKYTVCYDKIIEAQISKKDIKEEGTMPHVHLKETIIIRRGVLLLFFLLIILGVP